MLLRVLIFLLLPVSVLAQQADSLPAGDSLRRAKATRKAIYGSARQAAIMSAVIPGLGQAYNRKYWKIPVIYAGLGGFAYLYSENNTKYRFYRKNLIAEADDKEETVNETDFNVQQLQAQKLYYRRYRDFGIIGMGIIYLVNIVDANVDAHLRTFDVSDDLGVQLRPRLFPAWHQNGIATAAGLTLKLTIR